MADFTPFPGAEYNVSLADLLARNIFGAQGVSAPAHNRVPFVFTSDMNLENVGNWSVNTLGLSDLASTLGYTSPVAIPDQTTNVRDSISTWTGPNSITSGAAITRGAGNNDSMIAMAVNPNSIRWDQPKRFAKKDTQTGSLFLFFSDNAGENNDILTLTMSGTTGNIDVRALNNQQNHVKGHAIQNRNKLLIWHKLYNLTRQPMFFKNSRNGTVKQNNFYIIYRTLLMPMEIRFVGFFSKVLDFTENAMDPFKRDYTMQFTVVQTDPPLSQLVSYARDNIGDPRGLNLPGAVTAGPSTPGQSLASPGQTAIVPNTPIISTT
jgi:hypothetical protein